MVYRKRRRGWGRGEERTGEWGSITPIDWSPISVPYIISLLGMVDHWKWKEVFFNYFLPLLKQLTWSSRFCFPSCEMWEEAFFFLYYFSPFVEADDISTMALGRGRRNFPLFTWELRGKNRTVVQVKQLATDAFCEASCIRDDFTVDSSPRLLLLTTSTE